MAKSKCPSCGHMRFELKETQPTQSMYELLFVQCSSCGAAVGVIEGRNITDLLLKQNRVIKQIAMALGVAADLEG